MSFTPAEIKGMLTAPKSASQAIAIKLAERIKTHSEGRVPTEILNERRPHEHEEVKKYRCKIYVSKTESPMSKVFKSLSKIRRSQDWYIRYKDTSDASIRNGETMQEYCELNYPKYGSITKWTFDILLKKYLIDPNGLIVVIPNNIDKKDNEYYKPVASYVDSDKIIHYTAGDSLAFKSEEKINYKGENNRLYQGEVVIAINTTHIERWEQRSKDKAYTQAYSIPHNLGCLPVVEPSGDFSDIDGLQLKKSRIYAMIACLDEAAREYSDLQAEVVQHVYSERIEMGGNPCKPCNGSGVTGKINNGQPESCNTCGGSGIVSFSSPYKKTIIKQSKNSEQPITFPNVAYVQKNTEIVKLQSERVREHIKDAYAAINMEFLAQTPLNQSGIAKEVDRDELNNFVYLVAEDLVSSMDGIYSLTAKWRYQIQSINHLAGIVPIINVPERFDLLSSKYLVEEIKAAREASISPALVNALERDMASKKFYNNPELLVELELCHTLDPMPYANDNDKAFRLQNGGVSKEDYIVSTNISRYVRRALIEDKNFHRQDYQKQVETLYKYASEVAYKTSKTKDLLPAE